jgi:signal transduction histidine kinase
MPEPIIREPNQNHIYKSVLVIDDTDIDRLLAEKIVKKYNFAEEVVLMESAEEMLDYLHQLPDTETDELLQLILLDINMPEIDGWEFLKQFDLLDKNIKDQFRIFVVSSSKNAEDKERALSNEYVLDYVEKPLSKEVMLGMNARLEQRVRERTRYLTEALDKEKTLSLLKSRFVSLASHEFRTPLSGILSSANLLSKYVTTEDQPKRDKHIATIISSVNILTEILNDFLSVGKIEEGKVYVRPVKFDIQQYINILVNDLQAIARPGQQLHYKHEGPDEVCLDSSLLRHILMNLITNAIKFSLDDGIIEIATRNNEGSFIISVRDYGLGIPEEDQQHLFELFFRGANVTNIQGTGLGLHIIAKYVALMKGKIDYTTELNKGTEFVVSFSQ